MDAAAYTFSPFTVNQPTNQAATDILLAWHMAVNSIFSKKQIYGNCCEMF
jgi:hypothetical protein